MTTIRATFRVTTPMFCGGAQQAGAELRVPSFKGVLRFWWRACAWSRFHGELGRIREQEQRIFGSPGTGQSHVTIRIAAPAKAPQLLKPGTVLKGVAGHTIDVGARYLGYGLIHAAASKTKEVRAGELIRHCLKPPFDVTFELRARELTEDQRDLLVEALRALGLLGGMGARSRRGLGSLSLISIDGDVTAKPTNSLDELRAALRSLQREGAADKLPGYTALSSHSRILVGRNVGDALEVLNELGEEYKAFRQSKRRDGKKSMLEHDAAVVLDGRPADSYPKRVAFGLPINYQNGSVVVGAAHDRRASPLFFHIHDCAGRAVAVASFLPAHFLPESKIAISEESEKATDEKSAKATSKDKRSTWRTISLPDEQELYRPVREFLDYLSRPSGPFEKVWGES